jgi:hypothetical protein
MRVSLSRGILIVAGLLLLGLVLGCPGELPRSDGAAPAAEAQVWPDLPPPAIDQPPTTPPDAYSSAPFGCESAADCFGQECCPTAWGTRVCAPSCGS